MPNWLDPGVRSGLVRTLPDLFGVSDPLAADGDYRQQQQERPGAGEYREHGHIKDRVVGRSLCAELAGNIREGQRRRRLQSDMLGRWFQPGGVCLDRRELEDGSEEDRKQRDDEHPGQRRSFISGHGQAVCLDGLLDVGGVQGSVFADVIWVADGAVGLVAGSANARELNLAGLSAAARLRVGTIQVSSLALSAGIGDELPRQKAGDPTHRITLLR